MSLNYLWHSPSKVSLSNRVVGVDFVQKLIQIVDILNFMPESLAQPGPECPNANSEACCGMQDVALSKMLGEFVGQQLIRDPEAVR
jgi:hypothetical protein